MTTIRVYLKTKKDTSRAMKQKAARCKYRNAVRGAMLGAAIGDALAHEPREVSQPNGMRISQNTQLALFVANNVLFAETRVAMRGIGGQPSSYVHYFLRDWRKTQYCVSGVRPDNHVQEVSWLLDIPELFAQRPLKNTDGQVESEVFKEGSFPSAEALFFAFPISLRWRDYRGYIFDEALRVTKGFTHRPDAELIAPALFAEIIAHVIYHAKSGMTLKEIILKAIQEPKIEFEDKSLLEHAVQSVKLAMKLVETGESNVDTLERFGNTPEDILGAAIYCALTYPNDIHCGIGLAAHAAPHDNRTIAMLTGCILGAMNGGDALDKDFLSRLELKEVIQEMADDLSWGCLMSEYSYYRDVDWDAKYRSRTWPGRKQYHSANPTFNPKGELHA